MKEGNEKVVKVGDETIKIRRSNKKDVPRILQFIKDLGFTERSLESWFGDNMDAVIALENDSIVGVIPFSVRQLKVNENLFVNAGHVSAVGIKEEYRSQGIGSNLISFLKDNYSSEIDCVVVNREDKNGKDRAYKWYIKNGFLDLMNVRYLYANVSDLPTYNQGKFKVSVLKIDDSSINNINYNNLLKIFNLTFREVGGFQKRDKDFLVKRFNYHYYKKFNTYYLLTLSKDKDVIAYSIFGKNFIRQKEGKIDIFEYGFDRYKVNVKDLVSALSSFCVSNNIPTIRFVTSDEMDAYSELLSIGFKDSDGFKFMGLPLRPQILDDKNRWTFFSFDYI